MKKWFFFLFASMLLCSCSCLLSQIPPKYIYAEAGCKAPIPNYIPMTTITGGCSGFTVTQIPIAGTLILEANVAKPIIIKATGNNGKSSQITFTVTMLDTITPKITPLPALMAYETKQIKEMYDAADKMTLLSFKQFDENFPWDSLSPGLGPNADGEMLVTVSMDSAGDRKRFITMTDLVSIGGDTSKIYWNEIGGKPTEFIPMVHGHGWNQVTHPLYLDNPILEYPVDWRDFMDWQAAAEYMPIPKRTPVSSTTPPNLALVDATINFTPLIFDPVNLKMKFWNGTVWKTITSN